MTFTAAAMDSGGREAGPTFPANQPIIRLDQNITITFEE
jgi:hypothetical protein